MLCEFDGILRDEICLFDGLDEYTGCLNGNLHFESQENKNCLVSFI